MRCSRNVLWGLYSAGVPVFFGLASFMALLYVYAKLFYTNFYPQSELVESMIRYVVAGTLVVLWLFSWFRLASLWKRRLLKRFDIPENLRC